MTSRLSLVVAISAVCVIALGCGILLGSFLTANRDDSHQRRTGESLSSSVAADPSTRCPQTTSEFGAGTLVAAFAATTDEVAQWQERRHQMVNPPIRSRFDATATIAVCYYDGEFGAARAPAGFAIPDYDRIVVLVGPDDQARLYVSAHQNSFPIEDPRPPDD